MKLCCVFDSFNQRNPNCILHGSCFCTRLFPLNGAFSNSCHTDGKFFIYQQRTRNTSSNTHSDPLHLQEDCSLEGFLPDGQVGGQPYPEGVALAVPHQNAEAQRLVVLLIGRMFEAQVEPRLEPAVLRHPQLQCKTKITVCLWCVCKGAGFANLALHKCLASMGGRKSRILF